VDFRLTLVDECGRGDGVEKEVKGGHFSLVLLENSNGVSDVVVSNLELALAFLSVSEARLRDMDEFGSLRESVACARLDDDTPEHMDRLKLGCNETRSRISLRYMSCTIVNGQFEFFRCDLTLRGSLKRIKTRRFGYGETDLEENRAACSL